MKHRLIRLLGLLAVLALLATACGSTDDAATDTGDDAVAEEAESEEAETEEEPVDEEPAEEESVEEEPAEEAEAPAVDGLTIWADENRVEAVQAVAPAFTEATGVDVSVELVPFGDIREQVTTAGPAGEGPDIFVGAHDWTGELAANGVIDPIDVSAISDNFLQVALDGFNFEGNNYAIPNAIEAVAMYVNTDVVSDIPTTWDELAASCEGITVENCVVIPGGGDAADAYHNYPFVSAFGGFIFAFDESTGFDASQVGLDDAETIEGIQLLADQTSAGVIASTNYDTAKNLWLEGNAAYWITGPWELGGVQEQTAVANWTVAPLPAAGDQAPQPFVGAQGFFLSAFSENALLAQSFLQDFIATDDTMNAFYDADPRPSAWAAVSLADDASAFSESAATGIPMPNIPQMGSVWGPLGDNVLLVRNGEIDAETAMTTAAEAVRAAVAG